MRDFVFSLSLCLGLFPQVSMATPFEEAVCSVSYAQEYEANFDNPKVMIWQGGEIRYSRKLRTATVCTNDKSECKSYSSKELNDLDAGSFDSITLHSKGWTDEYYDIVTINIEKFKDPKNNDYSRVTLNIFKFNGNKSKLDLKKIIYLKGQCNF